MNEMMVILGLSFFLDLLIGDPSYRYHPIRIIGCCISYFEGIIRKCGLSGRGGGILLAFAVGITALCCYLGLHAVFAAIHDGFAFLFNLYLCYSCLALGDLFNHIKPVIQALEKGDLKESRGLMARTVSRNIQLLDRQGLCRAAVETLAENYIDGFLSPVFWYFLGGVLAAFLDLSPAITAICFMLIFKVASTLDSMVGYRSSRYIHFGWAGARLDDLMNFLPARLSIIFFFLGAMTGGCHPVQGTRVFLRDRLKHDSPNSAHAESFVAGALGIRLGGKIPYAEGYKDKGWLGEWTGELDACHITQTIKLLRYSAWFTILTLLAPFIFTYYAKTL